MSRPLPVLIVLAVAAALAAGACSPADRPAAGSTAAAPPSAMATPGAATDAVPAAAAQTSRPRIVFLGDSLTAGYGIDLEQAVPALVQKHLEAEGYPYEVVNAGVSGDTSAGGLRRLDWSLDGNVRILVIELGANDGLRGLPVKDTKQNLKAIIAKAKERRIEVLLTGMEAPPNYGQAYTSDFRRVFSDVAGEEHVAFMPFYLYGIAGIPNLNIADGIHPNPAGAKIVEANLWRVLEPMLDKQPR